MGFTASLIGGGLIGLSATLLWALNGRVAGISGIFGGLLRSSSGERDWKVAFLGGLLGGGVALRLFAPHVFGSTLASASPWLLLVSGVLVGAGSQLGRGCTSGHGVCGIARGSPRSLVATGVFMAVAAAVVFFRGAP